MVSEEKDNKKGTVNPFRVVLRGGLELSLHHPVTPCPAQLSGGHRQGTLYLGACLAWAAEMPLDPLVGQVCSLISGERVVCTVPVRASVYSATIHRAGGARGSKIALARHIREHYSQQASMME